VRQIGRSSTTVSSSSSGAMGPRIALEAVAMVGILLQATVHCEVLWLDGSVGTHFRLKWWLDIRR
jgi:hypothetical protein